MAETVSKRKVWIVIYGEKVPAGEVENAKGIAKYLRSGINIARALPAKAMALDLLAMFCNFVIVGGPYANEWAFKLNRYVNPRYEIEVLREKDPKESWKDYVKSGGFKVKGFLKNSTRFRGISHYGLIGKGSQPYMRLRPLEIIFVSGWDYGDTCTMGKAFRQNSGAGIYTCTYPTLTYEEPCPSDEKIGYKLITDP